MNSYQQNLAVNTLLSLDTASNVKRSSQLEPREKPEDSFQNLLADQERPRAERSEKRPLREQKEAVDTDNKPLSAERADESAPKTEQGDDTLEAKPEVAEASEEQAADSDEETPEEGASQHPKEAVEEVPVEGEETVEPVLDADQPLEGESTEEAVATENQPLLAEGEQQADSSVAEEEVAETAVPMEAAIPPAQQQTIDTAKPTGPEVRLQSPAEVLNLREYRVNAAGKPIEVNHAVSSEEGVSEFKVDIDALTSKSSSSAALPPESKASAARQLNNLVAQIATGQGANNSEQMLKDLSARMDSGSTRGSVATAVAAAAAAQGGRASGTAQSTTPANPLQAPFKGSVGQPKWQAEVAERVAIMASKNIKSAEIQLDPPELGPLQVKVTVNQDQASVAFASQHAQVREALDQTAFRLREMLQQEGMTQVDVDVSDQSFAQDSGDQNGKGGPGSGGETGEEEQEMTVAVPVSNNLVDHFV